MSLDLRTYRLLPFSSESRVGPQNLPFTMGSEDDLPTCLTPGYLNDLVNTKVPFENRVLAPGDLVFLNYSANSANSFWIITRVSYDGANYSLVAGGSPILWVPLPAGTSKWSSSAFVGRTIYGTGIVKGNVTSSVGANDDIMITFPAGYVPAAFSKAISYIRSGQPIAADLGTTGAVAGTSLTANAGDVAHLYFEYELRGD